MVLRPLLDLDLDDELRLLLPRGLAEIDRVADDAGAVVAAVVVEADEVALVLLEAGLGVRRALPEPPPPVLWRVLEPLAQRPVAEGLVADEDHVVDLDAFPLVGAERHGDPVVVGPLAVGCDGGEAEALLAEVLLHDQAALLDVGGADAAAPDERQSLAQFVALATAQSFDLDEAEAGVLRDTDREEDALACHPVHDDLGVRDLTALVEGAHGLPEALVVGEVDPLARAEVRDADDERLVALALDAFDVDAEDLVGLVGLRQGGEGDERERGGKKKAKTEHRLEQGSTECQNEARRR